MKFLLSLLVAFSGIIHAGDKRDEKPIKLKLFDSSGTLIWSAQGDAGQTIELEELVVERDQRFTLEAPKGTKNVDIRITGKRHCEFLGHATLGAPIEVVNQSGIQIARDAIVIFSPQRVEADREPE
ncbi:MAG: hypothetical protein WD342_20140 [Verrucomicrobiales bacterium]